MFFEDHQKRIYSPPNSDRKYDPLEVDHLLTVHSNNNLHGLISDRNAAIDMKGDISVESITKNKIIAAQAEIQLADLARKAFGLPPFPEMMTAEVLEILYDFLEWMEKKGERGEQTQVSSELSPEVSTSPTATNSISAFGLIRNG